MLYILTNIELGDEKFTAFDKSVSVSDINDNKDLENAKYLLNARAFGLALSHCSLDFLNNMPQLRYISIVYCDIMDFSGLSYQQSLEYCDISSSNFTNKDILFISNPECLRVLILDDTMFSDISLISNMVNLECLSITNTPITSINGIEKIEQLKEVYLPKTIVDYSPLTKCEKLEIVFCEHDSISSEIIDELKKRNIKIVYCEEGIPPKSEMNGLRYSNPYNFPYSNRK